MKKTLRLISLSLVVVMLAAVLVSCGPSGTYGTDNYTLKFSGSKVTVTASTFGLTTTASGTFKMGKDDDGNQTITFDFSDENSSTFMSLFNGTRSYNAGKDNNGSYIEIGGARYYKK